MKMEHGKGERNLRNNSILRGARLAEPMRIYPTCSGGDSSGTDSAFQSRSGALHLTQSAPEAGIPARIPPFPRPGQVNIIIHGIVLYYNERIPTGMSCCVSAVATATYVGLLDAEIRKEQRRERKLRKTLSRDVQTPWKR